MSTSGQTLACLPPVRIVEPEHNSFYAALVGSGAAMRRLRLQIERIGPHFRTVLVRGETGTGKELVARALHERSGRACEDFVVCCAASLEERPEGADRDFMRRELRFADTGTLFVDGVEELSMNGQRRLLHILEQKMGWRVIVAAAKDLRSLMARGRFREDLYHRLAMVEIVIEPLRNRAEEIPELAMHFAGRFSAHNERDVERICPEAMELLRSHPWPGNVRELENVIRNGVFQCEGPVLEVKDLISLVRVSTPSAFDGVAQPEIPARLQDVVEQHVLRVLQGCSGNKVRAAEVLGISRSTLYRILEGSVQD
jgi:DNA-binding NtrC family response regulator